LIEKLLSLDINLSPNPVLNGAYFTPCRARISPDAGPPFHVMPGRRFTHAGPPS
jgi:hypothetical protein